MSNPTMEEIDLMHITICRLYAQASLYPRVFQYNNTPDEDHYLLSIEVYNESGEIINHISRWIPLRYWGETLMFATEAPALQKAISESYNKNEFRNYLNL